MDCQYMCDDFISTLVCHDCRFQASRLAGGQFFQAIDQPHSDMPHKNIIVPLLSLGHLLKFLHCKPSSHAIISIPYSKLQVAQGEQYGEFIMIYGDVV